MKAIIATLAVLLAAAAIADNSATDPQVTAGPAVHRYLIERTFSAGVIDGRDAATKAKLQELHP